MPSLKANQVRDAICHTLGAEGARGEEIDLRLRRLIAADRNLGRNLTSSDSRERHFAFHDGESPGRGADIPYTQYEAFALLVGIMLLEHGLPQMTVVKLLREVRDRMQIAHAVSLAKRPGKIFAENEIRKRAALGTLGFDSTDPVILVFARLTGSSFDERLVGSQVDICESDSEVVEFMKRHRYPTVFSILEFSKLIHDLYKNLGQSRPVLRGRSSITEG
jgi:hypothetical protein